jgi:acetolactate synthase-1/2/3 large subunit
LLENERESMEMLYKPHEKQQQTASSGSRSGAWLTVRALEHLPVTHTFGIPGVHVTELYDELGKSKNIRPVLVTHECGAAFMADALSRTSDNIGVLAIVPAAGVTHAMSGIGEAYLAGIPMLVIAGGVRRDTGRAYQLHDLDMQRLLEPLTKKTYLIQSHREIAPILFEAYALAVSGEPGPVFVEIPADILLMRGPASAAPPALAVPVPPPAPTRKGVETAAELLRRAERPGLFLGWGCRDCTALCISLAELLQAPVATTLQGLSVFPGDHPLHTGMGFGPAAVPAAENAFAGCDCLLAAGTRFSEIPTGSYSIKVPPNLIHIDINPEVFNQNYPAKVVLPADAGAALGALVEALRAGPPLSRSQQIRVQIAKDKQAYLAQWRAHRSQGVNPAFLFQALRKQLAEDALVVVDDGNHTYLTAELFSPTRPRHLICPTDFNCMGYCVPATIGAKLANPHKQVVGVVGDGAFLMSCMEIVTAASENLGVVYLVFCDGELAQISQVQHLPYNRKVCTVLGTIGLQGVADAVGARYLPLKSNGDIEAAIGQALSLAGERTPVIVGVDIDYAKRTRFTKGVIKANLDRLPPGEKRRFIGRALWRKVAG